MLHIIKPFTGLAFRCIDLVAVRKDNDGYGFIYLFPGISTSSTREQHALHGTRVHRKRRRNTRAIAAQSECFVVCV